MARRHTRPLSLSGGSSSSGGGLSYLKPASSGGLGSSLSLAALLNNHSDPTAAGDYSNGKYLTALAEAKTLHTPSADSGGTGPLGLLTGALHLIETPKNAIVGYINGSDASSGAQNIMNAVLHGQQFSLSDKGAIFHSGSGDSRLEHILNGVGAFVGDTALDPASYVTGGTAGVGRTAASKALAFASEKWAGEHIGEAGLKELAQKAPRVLDAATAATGAKEAALAAGHGADAAEALYHTTLGRGLGLAEGEMPDWAKLGAQHFRNEVGAAYLKAGPAAARLKAGELLGSQAKGNEFFKALHGNLRGGLRVRGNPLGTGRGAMDAAKPGGGWNLTGGGGLRTGLIGVKADAGKAALLNGIRRNGAVSAVRDHFGEDSAAYTNVLRALKDPTHEDGLAFGKWIEKQGLHNESDKIMHTLVGRYNAVAAGAVSAVDAAVKQGVDPQQAKDTLNRFYLRRGSADAAAVAADVRRPQWERDIAQSAADLHAHYDDLHAQAAELGLNIGHVDDYVHRVLTDEFKELKAMEAPARSAGLGAASPLHGRSAFGRTVIDPATGAARTVYDDIPTINEKMADLFGPDALGKVFKDDTLTVHGAYSRAMHRAIHDAKLTNHLVRSGLAVRGAADITKQGGLDVGRLAGEMRATARGLADDLRTAGDSMSHLWDLPRHDGPLRSDRQQWLIDHLHRLADNTPYEGEAATAREKAEKLAADFPTAEQAAADHEAKVAAAKAAALAGLDDDHKLAQHIIGRFNSLSDYDKAGAAGEILTQLSELEGRRASRLAGAGLGRAAQAAGARSEQLAGSRVEDYFTRKTVADYGTQAFRRQGLVELGKGATKNRIFIGSPEAADLLVSRSVRQFAHRLYTIDGKEMNAFAEKFWNPLFTMLRTSMTTGRGPGFVLRNTIDALLAAWMNGANVSDVAVASRLVPAMQAAYRSGLKAGLRGDKLDAHIEAELAAKFGTKLGRYGNKTAAELWAEAGAAGALHAGHTLDSSSVTFADADTGARAVANQKSWRAAKRDGLSFITEDSGKAARGFKRGYNAVLNNPAWAGSAHASELSEQYGRFISYLAGVREYGDSRTAALMTKVAQFDYDPRALTDFERGVVRNIVPFWTWMKNNVPLQLRLLANQPGRMQTLFNAQNDLVYGALGDEGATDQLHAMEPDWLRRKDAFGTVLSRGGNPITLGIEAPMMDLDSLGNFAADPLNGRQALANLNPLIKAPLSAATGRNFDTGADYSTSTGTHAPAWMRLIPGLTHQGPDGQQVVSPALADALKTAVPTLGQAQGLIPGLGTSEDSQRLYSNLLSQGGGVPAATLTPQQVLGEESARTKLLESEVKTAAAQLGVNPSLLAQYIQQGASRAQLESMLPELARVTAEVRQHAPAYEDAKAKKDTLLRNIIARNYGVGPLPQVPTAQH